MRRLLLLALLLSVLAFAAGCGSDDEDAASTTAATETQASEPVRVGLVVDRGQLDDNGFNELAFRGLTRAEEELGVEGRVVESATAADYIPNMTTLARDGYEVYGIEASAPMLKMADDTTKNFDAAVRARMHWVQGDMRERVRDLLLKKGFVVKGG